MSGLFEVGASVTLRALHRLPWGEPAEREPHSHRYRVEVVVQRTELDDRGVVIDLDVLNAALDEVVNRLEGRDLDEVVAPAGGDGVTVEILARWIHGELRDAVRGAGGELLSIRVWETPEAFGGYRAAVG